MIALSQQEVGGSAIPKKGRILGADSEFLRKVIQGIDSRGKRLEGLRIAFNDQLR